MIFAEQKVELEKTKENRQTNIYIEIRPAINDNLHERALPKISTNTACMAVEGDDKLKVKMTMKYGKGIHFLINGKFILICLLANK